MGKKKKTSRKNKGYIVVRDGVERQRDLIHQEKKSER